MAAPNISASEVEMLAKKAVTNIGRPIHIGAYFSVVLQGDEHDGTERNHPKQRIAEGGACGEVARPVARVDEADGNQQARSDILEDVEGTEYLRLTLCSEYFQ